MNLTVGLIKRDFTAPLPISDQLKLEPTSYSWHAQGGPEKANITVWGNKRALWETLSWLRCGIEIYDARLNCVWWGYVAAVELRVGVHTFSVSLDSMSNKIMVVYSYLDSESQTIGAYKETAWATDADSIAVYGTKELIDSISGASDAVAEGKRAGMLADKKYPVPAVNITGQSSLSASLKCRGWFDTLGWQYYDQTAGLREYTVGSDSQNFGIGANEVQTLSATGVVDGGHFHVTYEGSTSGEMAWNSTESNVEDGLASLSTLDHADMTHSGGTLPGGVAIITFVGAKAETDVPLISVDSSALTGGGSYAFVETVKGAFNIDKLGRSFQITGSVSWYCDTVTLPLKKTGTPTDLIYVDLCADNAGEPGTVLAMGSYDGSLLTTSFAEKTFTLSKAVLLSLSTTYWLVLRRADPNSSANYYAAQVDTALGDAGVTLMYHSSAWSALSTPADMKFAVSGSEQTTSQIGNIVENAGEFFTGADIVNESGIALPLYRVGDKRALEEIKPLLAAGISGGGRLLATVTQQRELRIYAEPTKGSADYSVDAEGRYYNQYNQLVEPHTCPVAYWCRLKDVIPDTADVSVIANPSPFFVQRGDFNVQTGRYTPEAREAGSVWDIGGLK